MRGMGKSVSQNAVKFSLKSFDHSTGTSGGTVPKNTAEFEHRTNQGTIQSFYRVKKMKNKNQNIK